MSYYETSVAAGYKIVEDANLQDMASILGCELSSAKVELKKSLALATLTKPAILMTRQRVIMSLRSTAAKEERWNARFKRLAEIEKDAIPFFDNESTDKDSLENDAIAQLSFQDDIFKPLNHIPWMVMIVTLFKVWAVPAMTLMTPILAWILPYLLLKFVYALPISTDQYSTILQHLWAGNLTVPPMGFTDKGVPALPSIWTPKSIAQFLFFGFTFVQSIYQPIKTAMHLYTTDGIIQHMGTLSIQLRTHLRAIVARCPGVASSTLSTAINTLEELQDPEEYSQDLEADSLEELQDPEEDFQLEDAIATTLTN
jgi:cell division protein ZapA (FtsZ GTPase activity inhibitor)